MRKILPRVVESCYPTKSDHSVKNINVFRPFEL